MDILGLGYVGIGTQRLEEWTGFATRLLGMQVADKSRFGAALRMDDRVQRLLLDEKLAEGRCFFGWEMRRREDLDVLVSRLEAAGFPARREPDSLAERRGIAALVSFNDPAGNRLEAFYGPRRAEHPFQPGRTISGFRTGSLGLGHAVLTVASMHEMLSFYRDVLGFKLSDYMLAPFSAYFLHVNPRHHSLALIGSGTNGVHHLMVEVCSLDDVGQGYDIAAVEQGRVAVTLGRHSNDFVTSFYARSPSGFLVEYGWGGRDIDPARWEAAEITSGPSLWGHERDWLSPEAREVARRMRMQAATDGLRAPVHVIPGTFRINTAEGTPFTVAER